MRIAMFIIGCLMLVGIDTKKTTITFPVAMVIVVWVLTALTLMIFPMVWAG
jgi:hypothetical protein